MSRRRPLERIRTNLAADLEVMLVGANPSARVRFLWSEDDAPRDLPLQTSIFWTVRGYYYQMNPGGSWALLARKFPGARKRIVDMVPHLAARRELVRSRFEELGMMAISFAFSIAGAAVESDPYRREN